MSTPLFQRPNRPHRSASGGAALTVALCALAAGAHAQAGGAAAPATPPAAAAHAGIAGDPAVAVIVQVPKPWYAPRFVVQGRMRDTIPQYRALPGLAFKAYAFAQAEGHFGGIYLWKDLSSARAWFTPAWFARVERERGVAADVRYFQVVAAIDNHPAGTPFDAHSPSVASLWLAPLPAGVDAGRWQREAQATVATLGQVPGLLRRYLVSTGQGRVGHISLWRDSASAQRWWNTERATGSAEATIEWFDTPILLPSSEAGNQPRLPGL